MKTSFEIFADRLALPRDMKLRLSTLLDSDSAHQLVDEAERQGIAARTALIEKTAGLSKAYVANIGKPVKKALEAKRAYETSVSAMQLAHKEWMQAEGELYAFEYSGQVQVNTAERELLQSSDPRLSEFLSILAQKDDDVRNKVHYAAVPEPKMFGTRLRHFNNLEEIQSARAVLLDCMTRCREMQTQPLSSEKISKALAEMCASLVPALAPLDVKAPVVGKDNEVIDPSKAPAIWVRL